jgi:hypothetical protein
VFLIAGGKGARLYFAVCMAGEESPVADRLTSIEMGLAQG